MKTHLDPAFPDTHTPGNQLKSNTSLALASDRRVRELSASGPGTARRNGSSRRRGRVPAGGGKERKGEEGSKGRPSSGERAAYLSLASAARSLCLRFLNQLLTWVVVRPVASASSRFSRGDG